eukprot:354922-Chlamydomonas_euryale.AAC.10
MHACERTRPCICNVSTVPPPHTDVPMHDPDIDATPPTPAACMRAPSRRLHVGSCAAVQPVTPLFACMSACRFAHALRMRSPLLELLLDRWVGLCDLERRPCLVNGPPPRLGHAHAHLWRIALEAPPRAGHCESLTTKCSSSAPASTPRSQPPPPPEALLPPPPPPPPGPRCCRF